MSPSTPSTSDRNYRLTHSSAANDAIEAPLSRPASKLSRKSDAASSGVNDETESMVSLPVQPRASRRVLPESGSDYHSFRRSMLELYDNARELKAECDQGTDVNDRSDLIVQIEQCLDKLMAVKFGKTECLQRCVVAIQNVLLRIDWEQQHVNFVEDVSGFLKSRSHIDDSTVDHVYQILSTSNLDPFRGILTQ